MMIDKIINEENKKKVDLQKLKKSALPNVIYGVGSYANDVMKLFNKLEIKISAACVDEEYINKFAGMFYGMNVTALESISKKFDKFNLIIAYSNFIEARKKTDKISNVVETFFIDAPHTIDFFDYQYILENEDKFESVYNLLQDELSKKTLVAFINSKISGDPYSLSEVFDDNQYFNDILPFNKNEVYVDCGAYTGDTILKFIKKVKGDYKKIYAFEPDKINYDILINTVKRKKIKSIKLINKGCWSKKAKFEFKSEGGLSSIDNQTGNFIISVDTIDNIVQTDTVTLIKMDIEGSELEAIKGAQKTIKRDKPNLAICVYHKPEDLLTIPQYILQLVPDYNFFLRHHQFISWETVLYAIAKQ